jgi:UDP-N-acetylglucosamine acyltransferase
MDIHPTAIVHPDAEIAENVRIGPFSIVEAGAKIGPGCDVGPHCVIGSGTRLGENNRLFGSTGIGLVPQDLKHMQGAYGTTIIGDNNVFREYVTISSSTVYADDAAGLEKKTVIGDNGLFMACSHVGHDCRVGSQVIMSNSAALAGHVTVEDRVTISGLAGVHQFCTLGTMSFIGGMTRINRDVPPYMLIEGNPARCHGPNAVGLERSGMTKENIRALRKMYKLLYRSKLNTSQAVAAIEEEVEDIPEKSNLLTFIRNSQRGITK